MLAAHRYAHEMTDTTSVPSRTRTNLRLLTGGLILLIAGGFFALVGLVWIATFYISQGMFPVSAMGSWNIIVGAVPFIGGILAAIVGIVLVARSR